MSDSEEPYYSNENEETEGTEGSEESEVTDSEDPSTTEDEDVSSDEEGDFNTRGNVPAKWYEDEDHIGYDNEGNKILKTEKGDGIDKFLAQKAAGKNAMVVYDELNDQQWVVPEEIRNQIRDLAKGKAVGNVDLNEEYVDWYTNERLEYGLNANRPAPKRNFVPSARDLKFIARIQKGIRDGTIKVKDGKEEDEEIEQMWGEDGNVIDPSHRRNPPKQIIAPKMALPEHDESYNPPQEYLPNDEEKKEWIESHPDDRDKNYLPTAFGSLRRVGAYENFVQERFDRCLDLMLCPRAMKKKLNIDPKDLLPVLPKPAELRPFPTTLVTQFVGHDSRIRAVSPDPSGQFLVSGDDQGHIRLWETDTGRCLKDWHFEDEVVYSLAWNPNTRYQCVAAAVGKRVVLFATDTGDEQQREETQKLLNGWRQDQRSSAVREKVKFEWSEVNTDENNTQPEFYSQFLHHASVSVVKWHIKGDYLASVAPKAAGCSVMIHQISTRLSQNPFAKSQSLVQTVCFHPSKPLFFVATQQHVRVYNLVNQVLVKKLISGVKWISSIDVHHSGDHVLVGSYDKRVIWFDLDLGSTPYKTLRYHEQAVRSVAFHPRYPLMASASDDGTVHVFHSMVYNDFIKSPLVVPVKILRGHDTVGSLGVLDCVFHPTQPWLFTSGADHTIRLFQNIP
eukprot:TRINITY_DN775979_c0_g1_i1.p1 TRINITY_DN775979_c0_g1~~TRINITY_DN775979_c0_g1_i1.p1  ORF type:complete len:683 (+),score=197.25 TRINITY_DN775979_c0_g1_i1:27-2051(+)